MYGQIYMKRDVMNGKIIFTSYQLPKLRTSVLFKGNFCVEPYVRVNMNRKYWSVLAKLRCGIEMDRGKHFDAGNRLCQLCHIEEEDEYHFMFGCNQSLLKEIYL